MKDGPAPRDIAICNGKQIAELEHDGLTLGGPQKHVIVNLQVNVGRRRYGGLVGAPVYRLPQP